MPQLLSHHAWNLNWHSFLDQIFPRTPPWSKFLTPLILVHLAVEIIDSRVANWDITLLDTVADNASSLARSS